MPQDDWSQYEVKTPAKTAPQQNDWDQYEVKKKASTPVLPSTPPSSINGLNNFQNFPPLTNSPVTDPKERGRLNEQDNAYAQAQQQHRDELSARLDENINQLNPEAKAAMQKAKDIIAPSAEIFQTPKDVEDHYKFMQTPMGKTLGTVAYLGSKATKGSLDVLKGAAHLANLATNPSGAITGFDPTKDTFDKLDKLANYGLTQADQDRMEKGTGGRILSTAGMMAEFAPAVAGGEAADAPKAMMYLQGLGQGSDLANKLNISNPVAKEALIQGSGVVNLLLTDVFNGAKVPNAAKSTIVSGIAADALKDAAGKDMEVGAFKSLLSGKAQEFAQKFEQAPIEAMSHHLETAKTFTKLNVANFGLHKAVDALNDKPVFNENIGDLASGEMKALTQDAPIFSALPAIGALSKLFPNSGYKNDVAESLMNDPSEKNVSDLKQKLTKHAQQNEWTPEQTDATLKHVDAIADAAKTLPRNIAPDKKADAVDLVMNRNDLQDRLAKVQAQKETLDPSLADLPNAQETYLSDKIEQANDKLRNIVTGERTTYSKGTGEEDGKFFKTTNGQREEIDPTRYELENLERTSKTNQNESKNTGRESGQSTEAENEGKTGQTVGENEPAVQESGSDDEGRKELNLTGGDEPPVVKPQDNAIQEPKYSDLFEKSDPKDLSRLKDNLNTVNIEAYLRKLEKSGILKINC